MSAPVVETVTPAATAITLSESMSSSVYGQPVSFTAAVSSVTPGAGIPAGLVNFYDGSSLLGTASLGAAGQAVLPVRSLSAGSHSITAYYVGSTNFAAGPLSGAVAEAVAKANTTLALSESTATSTYGGPVSFTAGVSSTAGTPSGSVNFFDNGGPLGTASLGAAGQAVLPVSSLSAGTHLITASYGGDTNFTGSASPLPVGETVSLSLGGPGLPLEIAGQSYSTTLSAAGGSGSYSYSLIKGTLPGTLSLSPAGLLSGVATVAGTYGFTVLASDTLRPGVTGTQNFALTVNPGAPAVIAVSTPASATAGATFKTTVTVTDAYGNGYSGPVTLSASDGEAASRWPTAAPP
jgi:hypothetical protein